METHGGTGSSEIGQTLRIKLTNARKSFHLGIAFALDDSAVVALLKGPMRPMSTGCIPKDLLFFSLLTFKHLETDKSHSQIREGSGSLLLYYSGCVFFFGSPVHILEFEPLVFRGTCNILMLDQFMSPGILEL